jgi:hypothetical protein
MMIEIPGPTAQVVPFPAPMPEVRIAVPETARDRLIRHLHESTGTRPGSMGIGLLMQLYTVHRYTGHGVDAFAQPVIEFREAVQIGSEDGTGELLDIISFYGDDQRDEFTLYVYFQPKGVT